MLRSHQIALLEENKDPAGGGGTAPLFSEEQQAAIGQIVNSAVTSQLKRSLPNAIGEAFKSVNWADTLKLDEVLDGKFSKLLEDMPDDAEPDAGGGKSKGKKPAPDDAVARQLKELADKLENSEKARAEEARMRQEAETARSMDRATGELRNLLQPAVRGELLDLLVRDLSGQKRIKLSENGSATLTVKRAPYKGAPEQDEDLPLGEAVPLWLGSEDAKVFLPAPGTTQTTTPPKGARAPARPGTTAQSQLPSDPAARTYQQLQEQGLDPVAALLD